MKFAIAVVMFVCAAAGAQASWGAIAPGVSYVNSVAHGPGLWGNAWNGAWNGWNGAWNHGAAWAAPAAVAVHASAPWGLTAPGWHGGYPGIALSQGPHAAAAHGHGHEGVYVAKTRGAIHTAPLAGHINSATSVNVAPAPGTL